MASAPIDLRSDTVTRPTPDMRRAMAEAEVGDDVYGDDPTVRALETRVAERLGLQAALFVPSGTQGNQLAIGVQCRPGEEVILEEASHPFHYENGAIAALWGAQPRTVVGQRGHLHPGAGPGGLPRARRPPAALASAHRGEHPQPGRGHGVEARAPSPRWWPPPAPWACSVHLDGARLFNAEVAAGVPVSTWARLTDSTTVCFSKGLGAPVGSVLAGSQAFIAEARRLRKRLGGGMRQAGILAAAVPLCAGPPRGTARRGPRERARPRAPAGGDSRGAAWSSTAWRPTWCTPRFRWTPRRSSPGSARRGCWSTRWDPTQCDWCVTSTWTGPDASAQQISCVPRWRASKRLYGGGAARPFGWTLRGRWVRVTRRAGVAAGSASAMTRTRSRHSPGRREPRRLCDRARPRCR